MFEPPLEEAEMALRGAEKIVVTIAEKIRNH
jgi:hypothetical protein